MTAAEIQFNAMARAVDGAEAVTLGKLFGHPSLQENGKAFVLRYHDDLVFKLGRERVDNVLASHPEAMRFDPSGKGRAMKDWLHVPFSLGVDWLTWAESARKFVHDGA
jgi:hypothetical protein